MVNEYEFVFFYDTKKAYGSLSPHYTSDFTVDGKVFSNVAQFVLYMKVKHGGYNDIANVVSNPGASSPTDRKEIMRTASSLRCGNWEEVHVDAIAAGYYARFTQDPKLAGDLMVTYGKKLVFAHPYDRKLGIGHTMVNAVNVISSWGRNLAGIALMMVREKLVESLNRKDAQLLVWKQNNRCTDLIRPRITD